MRSLNSLVYVERSGIILYKICIHTFIAPRVVYDGVVVARTHKNTIYIDFLYLCVCL